MIDLTPILLNNDTTFSKAISYNEVDGGTNELAFKHEPFAIDKSLVGVPEHVAAEYTPTLSDVSVSFNIADVSSEMVVHWLSTAANIKSKDLHAESPKKVPTAGQLLVTLSLSAIEAGQENVPPLSHPAGRFAGAGTPIPPHVLELA